MNGDIYDSGTPKYNTARHIYDALCELAQTEEMGILSEIGVDVSWENQGYYYFDKGNVLKTKFEELSDYGNKMWIMDLAVAQLDGSEIHGTVYECLVNPDLAKRLGFKKLFVENILSGYDSRYKEISEEFADALGELDRFGQYESGGELYDILKEKGLGTHGVFTYPKLAYAVSEKVRNLRLNEETRLIAECRAHLTSYDDFLFGLRANQALYKRQEQMYGCRVAELKAEYNKRVVLLMTAAQNAGLLPVLNAEMKWLEVGGNEALISVDSGEEMGERTDEAD
jgi:hypothetical protein